MASRHWILAIRSCSRTQSSTDKLTASHRRHRAQRRAVLLLCLSVIVVLGTELLVPNPRTTWIYHRSSHWWEEGVLGSFTEHNWMENFRMTQETFIYLCDQLKAEIEKQNTRMRCVSTERRVAITLWVLATPSEYRSVAHLFGVARCTVCKIVRDTCIAIVKKTYFSEHNLSNWRWFEKSCKGFQGKMGCSTMCWIDWWFTCTSKSTHHESYWLL